MIIFYNIFEVSEVLWPLTMAERDRNHWQSVKWFWFFLSCPHTNDHNSQLNRTTSKSKDFSLSYASSQTLSVWMCVEGSCRKVKSFSCVGAKHDKRKKSFWWNTFWKIIFISYNFLYTKHSVDMEAFHMWVFFKKWLVF